MPESPKEKPAKAESFVGNVMKYSIATYLGFLISGAALIIKGVLPADTYAVPATFMAYTMSLMNLGMLGLDQALLRFYREPPEGTTGRGMFLACVRLSLLVMLVVGAGASVFFAPTLSVAFGLGQGGTALVPFLFLNAALYMLVRYVNVLLRLENDVRAYTMQTLWMNACLNLIYLLPGFFTSNTWAFIAAALAGVGLRLSQLEVAMRLGTTEGIKSFVRNSDAMALVSVISVVDELRSGALRIVDIEGLTLTRDFSFVHLAAEPAPLARQIADFAQSGL